MGGRGGRGGWSTWTSPCSRGWSEGGGGGNRSCPGRNGGRRAPPPAPPEMWVKMFELAHLFTPERKKAGATHCRFIANCWQGLGSGGWSMGRGPGPGRRPCRR